jgi:hypothetical protein
MNQHFPQHTENPRRDLLVIMASLLFIVLVIVAAYALETVACNDDDTLLD